MDGEDPPTQRDGGQVERRRGSTVGRAKEIKMSKRSGRGPGGVSVMLKGGCRW